MQSQLTPVAADEHIRGAPNAAVTIVQYGDYECPHTRASAAILGQIMDELSGELRLVFRHFPLRRLHPNAQTLAEIAESAGQLGHFWEVHEHLMQHTVITQERVLADLRRAHVRLSEIEPLLGSSAIVQRVERDVQSGTLSGVHSTPTFFFNNTMFDGHYDKATLLSQIARARSSSH